MRLAPCFGSAPASALAAATDSGSLAAHPSNFFTAGSPASRLLFPSTSLRFGCCPPNIAFPTNRLPETHFRLPHVASHTLKFQTLNSHRLLSTASALSPSPPCDVAFRAYHTNHQVGEPELPPLLPHPSTSWTAVLGPWRRLPATIITRLAHIRYKNNLRSRPTRRSQACRGNPYASRAHWVANKAGAHKRLAETPSHESRQ